MRILTTQILRDVLAFKGPMDDLELSHALKCPILQVTLMAEKGVTLGILDCVGGVYSTTWREYA